MRPFNVLLAAGAAMAIATTAPAAVVATLSDFEPASFQSWQGVNGWFGYGGNPVAAVTNDSAGIAASVAGSTQVMEVVINNQYWGQITAQNWANSTMTLANYTAADHVEFDLYLPATFTWPGLSIYLSGDVNGPSVNPDLAKVGQWQHISAPIGAISKSDLAANTQLFLNPGWGTGGDYGTYTGRTVYLDNIALTAVPEPAVLATLAACGLMVLRQRRRHRA